MNRGNLVNPTSLWRRGSALASAIWPARMHGGANVLHGGLGERREGLRRDIFQCAIVRCAVRHAGIKSPSCGNANPTPCPCVLACSHGSMQGFSVNSDGRASFNSNVLMKGSQHD
jgi:hypothetical protein